MGNNDLVWNTTDPNEANTKSAVIEKSFISGETSFYFEPHAERWYITREQAALIAKSLIDFIATNATAPGDESGADDCAAIIC